MAAIAVALVTTLALSACWTSNQNKLLSIVNDYRKANGKAALVGNKQAMDKAQAWSESMARKGVLEHTGGGSALDTRGLPKNCAVAENVALASSIQAAHDKFVTSRLHRANMLGNYTHVGLGIVRSGDKVWVTEIFYRAC